jgi:hypothetical protein
MSWSSASPQEPRTAVLLYALDALPPVAGGRSLRSCDVEPTCYFDRTGAIGDAARVMYPTPRATWMVDGDLDSRRLSQQLPPESADLTFIDANHAHPWPPLDLLHATAFAQPQSWMVLHDINLPAICPGHGSGAKQLYDAQRRCCTCRLSFPRAMRRRAASRLTRDRGRWPAG